MANDVRDGILSWDTTLSIGGTVIDGLMSIPSLGGSPEKVDITTLADHARRYMNGVKDYGDLDFKFLYLKPATSGGNTNYAQVKAFEGQGSQACIVTLDDGTAFTFSADINASLDEAEVNQPLTFTVSCGLSSDITLG